jgi:SAM-dependent methyltransferase
LLRTFPEAQIWGVDLSPEMLAQSRKRNLEHSNSGRLILIEGDPSSLSRLAPLDLVLAVHVLYFWRRPDAELAQIRAALRPGGCLALGYQLRQNMPPGSQRNFLKEGYRLYESDDDVATLLREAGFKNVSLVIKGPSEAPEGRLALATT